MSGRMEGKMRVPRAIQMSITAIAVLVLLLVSALGIAYFFREQMMLGDELTSEFAEKTKEGASDIEIDPAKIFCSTKKFKCSINGIEFSTEEGYADPYTACKNNCGDGEDPGECTCVK